jgi:Clp amino terminal domain, pathogenicity island component
MRTSKAAIAAVLVGAVALASAAYGIGTQTDDGTAAARGDRAEGDRGERGERDFGPPEALFGDLADELGVDADELRDALMDYFEQREGDRSDDFSAALAEALGKPVDDVEAALEAAEPGERRRGPCGPHVSLRRLAAELDVTRAELRKALREVRAGADEAFEARREGLVKFLAERFGVSEDKVRNALPDFPGRFGDGPGRFGDGPPGPHPGGWGGMPG